VNGSVATASTPMALNFAAAQSIARSDAGEPVGRPPMWSQSSRKSPSMGVAPSARTDSRCAISAV
jgi:hypothetical protein